MELRLRQSLIFFQELDRGHFANWGGKLGKVPQFSVEVQRKVVHESGWSKSVVMKSLQGKVPR